MRNIPVLSWEAADGELWGFGHGQEWWVAHYLFRKRHLQTEIVANNRSQS